MDKEQSSKIKEDVKALKIIKWGDFLLTAKMSSSEFDKFHGLAEEDVVEHLENIEEALTHYAKIFKTYHEKPEKRPAIIEKYASSFTKSGFAAAQKEDKFESLLGEVLGIRAYVRELIDSVAIEDEEEVVPEPAEVELENVDEPSPLFDRTHDKSRAAKDAVKTEQAIAKKKSAAERRAEFLRTPVGPRPRTRNVKPQ